MVPPHDELERDPDAPSSEVSHAPSRPRHRMDRFSAGWPPAEVDREPVTAPPVRSPFTRARPADPQEREALRHLPSDYRDRPYLTVGDVAVLLGVTTQTVRNWSDAGRLSPIRTPGGHRRFPTIDVARLMGEIANN